VAAIAVEVAGEDRRRRVAYGMRAGGQEVARPIAGEQ
jgi:hypothetical protein